MPSWPCSAAGWLKGLTGIIPGDPFFVPSWLLADWFVYNGCGEGILFGICKNSTDAIGKRVIL